MSSESVTTAVLDRSEAVKLLGTYWAELSQRRQISDQYTLGYTTFLGALLTAIAAGISSIGNGSDHTTWIRWGMLALGAALAIIIAELGKKSVKAQKKHVREVIVLIAKLDHLIGLDLPLTIKGSQRVPSLWPDDLGFVCDAWIEDRWHSGRSSAEFISGAHQGTAHRMWDLFSVVQFVSAGLAIGAVVGMIWALKH